LSPTSDRWKVTGQRRRPDPAGIPECAMKRTLVSALLGGFAVAAVILSAHAEDRRVITVNTVQIFGTIDPAKISDYTDYMATANLYDGLVNVDPHGDLLPELAESWEVSPDATNVTFHLRKDAKFEDGSPVEADDVVYSIERLLRINQGPANLFSGVLKPGSVVAVDPHTVKFTLAKTFSPFLSTVPAIRIVNAKLVKANAGADDGQTFLAANVAGAGPYKLKSWDRGTHMTIERDPNYYRGWGDGAIDEVRFIITNDEATVRSMAASGELTMTSQYQSPDTYDALAKMPRFKVVKGDTSVAFYLKLNTKAKPTDDLHVRKAIALATDYDTIRGTILPGGDLDGPLPKTFAAAHLEQPAPKFDLEAAKAEMEKSAYAGQTDLPLSLTYVTGTKFEEEIALLMQANLERLGFKVTLAGEPWNRVTEIASKVETTPNITEVFFGPTYPSPDSMFYTQYDSKAAGTWASMEWVQDPTVDKLIEGARATIDTTEQVKLYKELQQKLTEEQVDAFLETQTVRHAMDKCLEGYIPVPMQSFDYAFHKYKWTCK
jgi:peptide/nickel transport system substrate-binding protein